MFESIAECVPLAFEMMHLSDSLGAHGTDGCANSAIWRSSDVQVVVA